MKISRIPVEPDDDEPKSSSKLWRRPGVWGVAALCCVVAYLATRPKDQAKHIEKHHSDDFIGEVVAYQPVRILPVAQAQAPTATPPPATPAPTPSPALQAPPATTAAPSPQQQVVPPAPSLRNLMPSTPGKEPASVHTRMLVYKLPPPVAPATAPEPPPETTVGFKTAELPGLKASPAIDDTYQLMPGLLPLVLDSAIQSDVPGPIFAHLAGPVYSPKKVVLMEAGTQVIGRYESMGKGNRMQAAGMMAHTPNGVWVPLSGQPMGDDLGRAGLSGEVDNHIMQRFGASVLLTMTDQILQIVQAEASKSGNSYINLNSGGGGLGSLASQILQSQINIPATFSKHQGETMALLIDRPIDFSASYRIQKTKAPQ